VVRDSKRTGMTLQARYRFRRFLRNRGGNVTAQRMRILRNVLAQTGHFDAEQIVQDLKNGRLGISRATVYRTLAELEQCNLIRKVDNISRRWRYERAADGVRHEHILCVKCGKIIDVCDTILEQRIADVFRSNGFESSNRAFHFFGICKQCKAGMKNQP
jgi:Fur family ferric uptake transcriptional regulator